jgi:hypothetical protein
MASGALPRFMASPTPAQIVSHAPTYRTVQRTRRRWQMCHAMAKQGAHTSSDTAGSPPQLKQQEPLVAPVHDASLLAENERLLREHGLKPECVHTRAPTLLYTHRLTDWWNFLDAYGEAIGRLPGARSQGSGQPRACINAGPILVLGLEGHCPVFLNILAAGFSEEQFRHILSASPDALQGATLVSAGANMLHLRHAHGMDAWGIQQLVVIYPQVLSLPAHEVSSLVRITAAQHFDTHGC